MADNYQADFDSGPRGSVQRLDSAVLSPHLEVLLQTPVLRGYKPGPQGSFRVEHGQRRMQRPEEIKVGKGGLQQSDYAPLRHHFA